MRLTASVWMGCAANSSPDSVAKPVRSPATETHTLVNSSDAAKCSSTFTRWNHSGCSPHSA